MRERLSILWKYSKGYRGATCWPALAGRLGIAKTGTFFLLGYLVDETVDHTAVHGLAAGARRRHHRARAAGRRMFLPQRPLRGRSGGKRRPAARNTLYDHIQHLPFTYHDRMPTGELVQRSTSDVDAVRRFFADQAIGVVRIVLLFLVNFAALLIMNPKLALASIVVVPLVVIVSVFFFRKVRKAYDAYQDQDAVLSTTLQENLVGVRVVRAFARQEYETAKFEKENIEKYRRGRILLLMHSLFWPSTDILCASQVLAGFTLGALMVIRGTMTLGRVHYLRGPGGVPHLADARSRPAGGSRVGRAGLRLPDGGDSRRAGGRPRCGSSSRRAPARGEVEFRNVSFEYRGSASILRDISFHCRAGAGRRAAGPDRFRQDFAGQPAAALLRLHRRLHPARRAGTARLSQALSAAANRHRRAGAVPLFAHHPREHRLRGGARGARTRKWKPLRAPPRCTT